jgi:hypothetical protein
MVEIANDVDMSVAITVISLLKQLLMLVNVICVFYFLNVVISYVFDCWVLIAYMRALGMVK